VDIGYARASTAGQDLERQVEALVEAGVARERISLDEKSGATTDRPGLGAALAHARPGDVTLVHTPDRLGRTVRDTVDLIHELTDAGVGVRDLAESIRWTPRARRTRWPSWPWCCSSSRRWSGPAPWSGPAHARSVAAARGRRVGRPDRGRPRRARLRRAPARGRPHHRRHRRQDRHRPHQPVPALLPRPPEQVSATQ